YTTLFRSARREELRRLRARLPPDDVVLDLVELLEGAVDTFICRQHLVDVGRRHAVGHQCDLQIALRALTQGPLARELLRVEEVGPAAGRLLQLVLVVGEDEVPHDGADAAFMLGGRQIAVLAADSVPIDRQKHALVAAELQLLAFDLNDVPAGIRAALDLRAQHADAAIPALVDQLGAGGLEGLEVDLLLRVLIGAAPGNDRQRPVRQRAICSQANGGRDGGREYRFLSYSHRYPPKQGFPSLFCLPDFAATDRGGDSIPELLKRQDSCVFRAARRARRPPATRSAPLCQWSAPRHRARVS